MGEGRTKTWTCFKDGSHEGNIGIMGPRTHAAWLCSVVFDGARAFEGVAPDLELHCARVNDAAKKLFLRPMVPNRKLFLGRSGDSDRRQLPVLRPFVHQGPRTLLGVCTFMIRGSLNVYGTSVPILDFAKLDVA